MTTALLIGTVAAALALDPTPPGLRPRRLYNGVHRPVLIEVPPAPAGGEGGGIGLVLMDASGAALAGPQPVAAGEIDLTAAMPLIVRLRRAGYLQMLRDGAAVGPALVLQPMLSRLVPVEREAVNPRGVRYTEIVAWRDETQPAEAPEAAPAAGAAGEGAGEPSAAWDAWLAEPGDPGRLFSGLRVYPERDVVLHTDHGDLRIALRPDAAPNTAWNFIELCRGGFYDGIVFHRVAPMTPSGDPFVIQAGDPTPSGSGGPGYWLPLERSPLPHDFGVISMARDLPPDSAGSQFFICLSRAGTARLDGHYCAFGYAVEGAGTILSIADVELADVAQGRPANPPVITSAELVPAPPRTPGRGRPDRRVRRAEPEASGTRGGRVPR